jgi:two-component system alkaline phosphatase synthesis response regulator PhoP
VSQRRVLQVAELMMDLDRREVMISGQPVELTVTEFNLLRTLLENPGYAFTRSELIEQALGYEYEGSERTLDSHMRNLRRKIELQPGQASEIQTVYGVGYRLTEP